MRSEIKEIIPHREPFLLIDEIINLTEEAAVGITNISETEDYFKGHFPSNPVVPGVLLLEMIAQVGAVALLNKNEFKGKSAYFTGVKKAKFKSMVKPGDKLEIKAVLTRLRGNIGLASGKIYTNDKLVCEAEISFIVLEDK